MPRHWYIKTKRGKTGPLNCRRLLEIARIGKISPNTGVSADGKRWIKAKNIKELKFADLEATAWFVKSKNGKVGPLAIEQLIEFFQAGKIKPNTAVSSDGKNWIKAKRVRGISLSVEPIDQEQGAVDDNPREVAESIASQREATAPSDDDASCGPAYQPPAQWAELREREYVHRFGAFSHVDHQRDPTGLGIDVYVHPPNGERPCTTLVTSGMSDYAMRVPRGTRSPRTELVLYVGEMRPAYIDVLRFLARVPRKEKSWIGYGSTMVNGQPPRPIFEGSVLESYVFMVPNVDWDFRIHQSLRIDHTPVQLLWVVPITLAEREVMVTRGLREFCALCDAGNLGLLVDPGRECMVRNKPYLHQILGGTPAQKLAM